MAKLSVLLLLLIFAVGCSSNTAFPRAATIQAAPPGIPITGMARIGNAEFQDFAIQSTSATGPQLKLAQAGLDGPGPGFIPCVAGSVCDLTWTLIIGQFGPACNCDLGSFNGTTGYLIGSLTFSGTAFVPADSLATITLPVTFTGQVVGQQLICSGVAGCALGATLFTINVSGTGTLNASQVNAPGIINELDYTFSGIASAI